ncbi:MAG: hypothetical protein IKN59_02305 [Paludibacteraceae bacterium]|jgi:hypothetical protein|nr:hypothetical protein [Paludibacteraceae bacterium]
MKTAIRVLLALAICFLCYICVMSVVTPIKFEQTREVREVAVVEKLVDIRTAQNEFRLQHGRFTDNLDSLVIWLQTGSKKEVVKEGALTDKQLEAGLTEAKAVKIIEKAKQTGNYKEVDAQGLRGFVRDTISSPVLEALFHGKYDNESIKQLIYIPYTDNVKFEALVNDNYTTSQGIRIPLVEVRAHYNTYLADLDDQERINLIDKEEQLFHYPGLKMGDVEEPNNNAGNWE